MAMLRLSVRDEEFLMIGDDVKIVFLGSSGGQTRIMIDAPKDVNIVRSKAIEKRIQDPELLATIPKYYKNPEGTAKKKKSNVVIVQNKYLQILWDKSLLTMRNPRAAVTINHEMQINGCICNTFYTWR